MKITVVSIGSFDTQYSDYHLMRDILVELLQRGHEVTLIQKQYLETPQYPPQFEEYLGNLLQVRNIRFEKKAKVDLKARYFADLAYYRQACRMMKDDPPDRIFLQSNNTAFYTVYYARHVLKRPVLYNEQDIFPDNACFAGLLSRRSAVYCVAHLLQKYAYRHAAALSTISDDMKSTIVTRYGVPKERMQVIYNWGHEGRKAHDEGENIFLKKYPKRPGEFRVVYAGNLGKMQNVELILETAALMKDAKDISFYIVGGGVNEEQLKKTAADGQLSNVTFAGMQPAEEVADLYAAADVNVIPLRHGLIYAALPSKTADCLIAGKPIITCVDGQSEFVKMVNRYGIENAETDHPEKLKEIILRVRRGELKCDDTALWSDHFTAGKSVAAHCDAIERMRLPS